MAQSCYFVTVDGELYEEVLVHKPGRNDLIGICMDMGFNHSYPFNTLDVEVQRVEICQGRPFQDTFFTNDELLEIRHRPLWASEIESRGYEVTILEDRCFKKEIKMEEIDPFYKEEE